MSRFKKSSLIWIDLSRELMRLNETPVGQQSGRFTRTMRGIHSAAQAEGLDDVFSRMDVMEAVRAAVDALPDPFREVVVLVDLEEQSYEDAARVLEIPKGTVRSRLFRGRRLLQEQLIEHARDAGLVRQQRPGVTREETSNDD